MRFRQLGLIALIASWFIASCSPWVWAPIEYWLDQPIQVSNKVISDVDQEIIDKITADLNPNTDACDLAKVNYVKGLLHDGRVPNRDITPMEYGTNNPLCTTFDLGAKFIKAADDVRRSNTKKNEGFSLALDKKGELIKKSECLSRFTDPKDIKIDILDIMFKIQSELNIPTESYKIYVNTSKIDLAKVKTEAGRKDLIDSDVLIHFADMPRVPAYFKGTAKAILKNDPKVVEMARLNLVNFGDATLLFFPNDEIYKLNKLTEGKNEYLLFPKGTVTITAGVKIVMKTDIDDAWCFWEDFKKEVKERRLSKP